ncbi:MAG: Holliday junction resolvase RuvX, partial [Erysipelatoclostridium sp.]|nr:Holliday junction resolvase RuvX [Thomasclavelia sp.]
GDESDMSKQVLIFKEKLEELFPNIKVKLIDERWSTKQATRTLLEADTSRAKRKKVIDKMAAQVILETYISQGE